MVVLRVWSTLCVLLSCWALTARALFPACCPVRLLFRCVQLPLVTSLAPLSSLRFAKKLLLTLLPLLPSLRDSLPQLASVGTLHLEVCARARLTGAEGILVHRRRRLVSW